jgi:hypothetical protein
MQAKPQDFVVYGFVKNAPQLSRRSFEHTSDDHNILCLALENERRDERRHRAEIK